MIVEIYWFGIRDKNKQNVFIDYYFSQIFLKKI